MNYNDGIFYVLVTLFTFLVNTIIKSLTDVVETSEMFKKRLTKYSTVSLGIVSLLIILLFLLRNKNTVFSISQEESVILFIIFISLISYLFLNATISTHFCKKNNSDRKKASRSMFWVNISMIAPIALITCIFQVTSNIIKDDVEAVIKGRYNRYIVEIPRNTFFEFVSSETAQQSEDSEINSILEYVGEGTELILKSGTEIYLNKETQLRFYKENHYLNLKNSETKLYLSPSSVVQLKKKQKVILSEDTAVSINNKNSFLQIPILMIYVLVLCLIIYYLFIGFIK